MDVREFEYFAMIAETGSVTQAANRLFITQSALSKFVQRKEEELGTKLFDRIGKRFVLTQAGEICLAACQEVLRTNHQMEQDVAQLRADGKMRVRLGFPASCSNLFFMSVYPLFLRVFPRVDLQLRELPTARCMELLNEGLLDLAICSTDSPADGYHWLPLRELRLVVMASPKSPLLEQAAVDPATGRQTISLSALQNFPMVMLEHGTRTRERVEAMLAQHGVMPYVVLETAQRESALSAVEYGIGAAILADDPASLVTHRDIQVLHFGAQEPESCLYAVCNKNKCLSKPEEFLIELFRQQYDLLGEHPPQ